MHALPRWIHRDSYRLDLREALAISLLPDAGLAAEKFMKRGVLFILFISLLTAPGVAAQGSQDTTAGESKILALENA